MLLARAIKFEIDARVAQSMALLLSKVLFNKFIVQDLRPLFRKGTPAWISASTNHEYLTGLVEICCMTNDTLKARSPHADMPGEQAFDQQYHGLFYQPFHGAKIEQSDWDTQKREALYGKSPFTSSRQHWFSHLSSKRYLEPLSLPIPEDLARYQVMGALFGWMKVTPLVEMAHAEEGVPPETILEYQENLCKLVALFTTSFENSHRLMPCIGPGCMHATTVSGISSEQPQSKCQPVLSAQRNARRRKSRVLQEDVYGVSAETLCCGTCGKYHLIQECKAEIQGISQVDHYSLMATDPEASTRIKERYISDGVLRGWFGGSHKGHPKPCFNLPLSWHEPRFSDTYASAETVPESGHVCYNARDTALYMLDNLKKAALEWGETNDALIHVALACHRFATSSAPFWFEQEGDRLLSSFLLDNASKFKPSEQASLDYVERVLGSHVPAAVIASRADPVPYVSDEFILYDRPNSTTA